MTEEPLVVRPETNMAAAAKILLDMKVSAALQCLGARSSISRSSIQPETDKVYRPSSAEKGFATLQVRRLPVVDDAGRLLGIFTRRDVIKAALATRKAAQGL
jgi:CBS domain-containing protein